MFLEINLERYFAKRERERENQSKMNRKKDLHRDNERVWKDKQVFDERLDTTCHEDQLVKRRVRHDCLPEKRSRIDQYPELFQR